MKGPSENETLSSRGLRLRRNAASLPRGQWLHAFIVDQIVEAVGELRGSAAADVIRSDGLGMLHTIIAAEEVGPLRERVIEVLRHDLLSMAVTVGRSVMHWSDEFYVDDYVILRINFPYDVARKSNSAAENPGVGRVSPSMRAVAKARRVTDPVYDPAGYHKGHPPAAWAHGPHVDSWSGHSKDGLNIWWAMGEVPAEAGMILYPELADKLLPCDPRSLYLRTGYPLPKPTFLPLQAGEMLIFDPEILHGTHLNLTDKTRVAVSLRLNVNKPSFDPNCFYAREFWRQASDVEESRFDRVLHLKREDHLAPALAEGKIEWPNKPADLQPRANKDGYLEIGPAQLVEEGARVTVATPVGRVILHRTLNGLRAYKAACPHYGVDLSNGAADDSKLYCPACGVAFDVDSGRSHATSLRLQLLKVYEQDGMIFLEFPDAASESAKRDHHESAAQTS